MGFKIIKATVPLRGDSFLPLISQELDGPSLWMGFNFIKATQPLQGDSFFATQSPVLI